MHALVNGTDCKLPEYATYEDVVLAAGGDPEKFYTVTYAQDFHGRNDFLMPKGMLRLGKRTVINVALTGRT